MALMTGSNCARTASTHSRAAAESSSATHASWAASYAATRMGSVACTACLPSWTVRTILLVLAQPPTKQAIPTLRMAPSTIRQTTVSYTHLRAHETPEHLV